MLREPAPAHPVDQADALRVVRHLLLVLGAAATAAASGLDVACVGVAGQGDVLLGFVGRRVVPHLQ
eukprot:7997017-Alexandrium_andersonii.AAC.1